MMQEKEIIRSAANPTVRRLRQLNTKARERHKENCFLAEGERIFREIPDELIREIYLSESYAAEHPELAEHPASRILEERLFRKVSDTQNPQGILTVGKLPSWQKKQLLGNGLPLLLILENVQDPGNAGTMIRTAEGAGVTGVILLEHTVDVFSPKGIRSTMGSLFRVPILRTEDRTSLLAWLSEQKIVSYAAHLQGKVSYTEASYLGGTAFFIGNEGNGLSAELSDAANVKIRIPMEGKVESLNAAVAASLLIYEARRQRSCVAKEK